MIEPKKCTDCGLPLPVTGRGQVRKVCGECVRGRRRVKPKPPTTCVECGEPFQQSNHTGPTPQRCDQCRVRRKKAGDVAKTARWRGVSPERTKAQWDKENARRSADPAFRQRQRDNELRRVYNLTREQLNDMIAAQGGVCAICGGGPNGPGERLHVDHCHDRNIVRGLLCGKCNTAVGLLDDNPERAEALANYLRGAWAPPQ